MDRRRFLSGALWCGAFSLLPTLFGGETAWALLTDPMAKATPGLGEAADVTLIKRFIAASATGRLGLLSADATWQEVTGTVKGAKAVLAKLDSAGAGQERGESVVLRFDAGLVAHVQRASARLAQAPLDHLRIELYHVQKGRIATIRHFTFAPRMADAYFHKLPSQSR